jgi:hypothetical protein
MLTAKQIADKINAAGRKHYNDSARGWDAGNQSRVYFGKEYVTIENGECHNRINGKARAKSIGDSAVELVQEFAN